MIHINITQLITESEMSRIEAEASLTAASMKLHAASREALRCRKQLSLVELSLAAHVRQTGLDADDLLIYFCHRAVLITTLAAARISLTEAEDAEASAEVEWESAVNHLTSLLQ
jgi:hypothetical protein